ncbi:hypothetical protein STEG23_014904 [Scotinomys teguina]
MRPKLTRRCMALRPLPQSLSLTGLEKACGQGATEESGAAGSTGAVTQRFRSCFVVGDRKLSLSLLSLIPRNVDVVITPRDLNLQLYQPAARPGHSAEQRCASVPSSAKLEQSRVIPKTYKVTGGLAIVTWKGKLTEGEEAVDSGLLGSSTPTARAGPSLLHGGDPRWGNAPKVFNGLDLGFPEDSCDGCGNLVTTGIPAQLGLKQKVEKVKVLMLLTRNVNILTLQ